MAGRKEERREGGREKEVRKGREREREKNELGSGMVEESK